MRIFIPSLRNLDTIPPTIHFVNYLNKQGEQLTIYSYHSTTRSFDKGVKLINLSTQPYPKNFFLRFIHKIRFHLSFYTFFLSNVKDIDVLLLGSWDVKGIAHISRLVGFKGKIVFQYHELELHKLKYCRQADFCLIPEVNRLWMSYFLGKLPKKPLLLPNIPYAEQVPEINLSEVIHQLKSEGKTLLLYQGLISFEKRCIHEILQALTLTPEHLHFLLMPSAVSSKNEIEKALTLAQEYQISHRVHLIPTLPTPDHLAIVKVADIGIGLYRPTSLNQVYAAPNRLFEFTRFGIPLLLPNSPVFEALSYKYPFAVNPVIPEDPSHIAKALNALLEIKNMSDGISNANRFFIENGDYNTYAKKVWETIKSAIQT